MEPDIITFKLEAPKEAPLDEVEKVVSRMKGFLFSKEGNALLLAAVEEESAKKEPLKFFIIKFTPSEIEVIYTVGVDESPSVRKLEVLSKTLPLIEPVIDFYGVKASALFALVGTALDEFLKKFTRDIKDVLIENDRLREKLKISQAREKKCEEEIKKLTGKLYELNSKLSELRLRLRKYEVPSDEALEEMLMEWIKEHNGSIDIATFSRINHIPVSRVEESLNRLVEKKLLKPL